MKKRLLYCMRVTRASPHMSLATTEAKETTAMLCVRSQATLKLKSYSTTISPAPSHNNNNTGSKQVNSASKPKHFFRRQKTRLRPSLALSLRLPNTSQQSCSFYELALIHPSPTHGKKRIQAEPTPPVSYDKTTFSDRDLNLLLTNDNFRQDREAHVFFERADTVANCN